MDEYIMRQAVLNAYEEEQRKNGPWRFETLIESVPASDVAPVVHAEWDSDERCTACGEKSTEGLDAEKWNYWLPPYCPHCGAKMDGEERSTD